MAMAMAVVAAAVVVMMTTDREMAQSGDITGGMQVVHNQHILATKLDVKRSSR